MVNLRECLETIKKCGFDPKKILDIGANVGDWTAQASTVFPDAEYVLINPYRHGVSVGRCARGGGLTYIVEILAECDKEVDWYGTGSVGDSIYREVSAHWAHVEPEKRQATSLDTLKHKYPEVFNDAQFDLIKIDTQGSEIPILKGGKNLIKNTSFILLEMPFFGVFNGGIPNFLEHIKFMDDNGFIPYNIVEIHQSCWAMRNALIQIDIMFIKKTHEINNITQNAINLT